MSYSVEYDCRVNNLTNFLQREAGSSNVSKLAVRVQSQSTDRRKSVELGRQLLFSELENIICEWFIGRKATYFLPHRIDVHLFIILWHYIQISLHEFK